jgi:hypothetical protein
MCGCEDSGVNSLFSERDDGQIDAVIEGLGLFSEALADSISSLPPRGARGNGPSTYWVDVAIEGLAEALKTKSDRPFTWGNSTLLRVREGMVEARYDYAEDDEDGALLSVDDFADLLHQWRDRIVQASATATSPLPETYRRNPSPSIPI